MSNGTKQHIPALGYARGLSGRALCGRFAQYHTGDHQLIHRLARAEGSKEHYCAQCLKKLSA